MRNSEKNVSNDWTVSDVDWCVLSRQIMVCGRIVEMMGRSLFPPISRGSWRFMWHLNLATPTWSRRWLEMCSGIHTLSSGERRQGVGKYDALGGHSVGTGSASPQRDWQRRRHTDILGLCLQLFYHPAGDCYSERPCPCKSTSDWSCQACSYSASVVHHRHWLQAEESHVESAWCPPLPELISSKADNTCPCPADYAEVSWDGLRLIFICVLYAMLLLHVKSSLWEPQYNVKAIKCQVTCKQNNNNKNSNCSYLFSRLLSHVFLQLIRRCRAQNPAHRPTFDQIKKFVHRINPIKISPVDMMMSLVTIWYQIFMKHTMTRKTKTHIRFSQVTTSRMA